MHVDTPHKAGVPCMYALGITLSCAATRRPTYRLSQSNHTTVKYPGCIPVYAKMKGILVRSNFGLTLCVSNINSVVCLQR